MEKIKHACQSANKRITASMQGSGSDFEKRMVRQKCFACSSIDILLLIRTMEEWKIVCHNNNNNNENKNVVCLDHIINGLSFFMS